MMNSISLPVCGCCRVRQSASPALCWPLFSVAITGAVHALLPANRRCPRLATRCRPSSLSEARGRSGPGRSRPQQQPMGSALSEPPGPLRLARRRSPPAFSLARARAPEPQVARMRAGFLCAPAESRREHTVLDRRRCVDAVLGGVDSGGCARAGNKEKRRDSCAYCPIPPQPNTPGMGKGARARVRAGTRRAQGQNGSTIA